MSIASTKLQIISQVLNNELIDELMKPLNSSISAKTTSFHRYKRKNNVEAYIKNVMEAYLYTSEVLTGPVQCEVMAYLGLDNRADYLDQFNNVCSELETRSVRVVRHYSMNDPKRVQEKDVILSKSMLLFAKHICELFDIYKHVAEKGESYKRLCELEVSRIIKPSFINMFKCPKLLLVYASMQPKDCLMVNIFNKLGTKTATMQHGLYVKYDKTNTINRINYQIQPAQHFLCWGENTSKLIQTFHPNTTIHACGRPIKYRGVETIDGVISHNIILICLDQKLYESENLEMVQIVIGAIKKSTNILYEVRLRLHPQLNPNYYKQQFPNIHQNGDLADASMVIGHTTTMLHELAYKGIKSYKLKTDAECVPFPDKYCFRNEEEFLNILESSKQYDNEFTNSVFYSTGEVAISNTADSIQSIIQNNIGRTSPITYEISDTFSSFTISNMVKHEPLQKFILSTTIFNDTVYYEKLIDSILEQKGNHDLHYIIKDASNDYSSTIKIGEIFSRKISVLAESKNRIRITYLHGTDGGMYEGLLDAFSHVKKELKPDDIIGYINADDLLEINAFQNIGFAFKNTNCRLLLARSSAINSKGGSNRRILKSPYHYNSNNLISHSRYLGIEEAAFIQQEGSFWNESLHSKVIEIFKLKPKLAGDYLIWKYLAKFTQFYVCSQGTGIFRIRNGQKSEDIDAYRREIKAFESHPLFYSRIVHQNIVNYGNLYLAISRKDFNYPLFATFRCEDDRSFHYLLVLDDNQNIHNQSHDINEGSVFAKGNITESKQLITESDLIDGMTQNNVAYLMRSKSTYTFDEQIQEEKCYYFGFYFLVTRESIIQKEVDLEVRVIFQSSDKKKIFSSRYKLTPHVNLYKLRTIIKIDSAFIKNSSFDISIDIQGNVIDNYKCLAPAHLYNLAVKAKPVNSCTKVRSSITVVTITYNDLDNLKKTIESFKRFLPVNRHIAFEYVIIDGNSTDGTQSYLHSESKFIDKFISEQDSGIYDAMNKGIKSATNEYVWFMNAGDEFVEHKLNDLQTLLEQGIYDVIYGDRIYINTAKRQEFIQKAKGISNIKYGMCFGHQSTIYKKQAVKEYMFNTTFKYAGDYEQLVRLYLNNKIFKYLSYPLCRFYSGGASESGIFPHLEAIYIQSKYFKSDILKESRYIQGTILHLEKLVNSEN